MYIVGERMTVQEAACHPFLASELGMAFLMTPVSGSNAGYPLIQVDNATYQSAPYVADDTQRRHLSSHQLLQEGTGLQMVPLCEVVSSRQVAQVQPVQRNTLSADVDELQDEEDMDSESSDSVIYEGTDPGRQQEWADSQTANEGAWTDNEIANQGNLTGNETANEGAWTDNETANHEAWTDNETANQDAWTDNETANQEALTDTDEWHSSPHSTNWQNDTAHTPTYHMPQQGTINLRTPSQGNYHTPPGGTVNTPPQSNYHTLPGDTVIIPPQGNYLNPLGGISHYQTSPHKVDGQDGRPLTHRYLSIITGERSRWDADRILRSPSTDDSRDAAPWCLTGRTPPSSSGGRYHNVLQASGGMSQNYNNSHGTIDTNDFQVLDLSSNHMCGRIHSDSDSSLDEERSGEQEERRAMGNIRESQWQGERNNEKLVESDGQEQESDEQRVESEEQGIESEGQEEESDRQGVESEGQEEESEGHGMEKEGEEEESEEHGMESEGEEEESEGQGVENEEQRVESEGQEEENGVESEGHEEESEGQEESDGQGMESDRQEEESEEESEEHGMESDGQEEESKGHQEESNTEDQTESKVTEKYSMFEEGDKQQMCVRQESFDAKQLRDIMRKIQQQQDKVGGLYRHPYLHKDNINDCKHHNTQLKHMEHSKQTNSYGQSVTQGGSTSQSVLPSGRGYVKQSVPSGEKIANQTFAVLSSRSDVICKTNAITDDVREFKHETAPPSGRVVLRSDRGVVDGTNLPTDEDDGSKSDTSNSEDSYNSQMERDSLDITREQIPNFTLHSMCQHGANSTQNSIPNFSLPSNPNDGRKAAISVITDGSKLIHQTSDLVNQTFVTAKTDDHSSEEEKWHLRQSSGTLRDAENKDLDQKKKRTESHRGAFRQIHHSAILRDTEDRDSDQENKRTDRQRRGVKQSHNSGARSSPRRMGSEVQDTTPRSSPGVLPTPIQEGCRERQPAVQKQKRRASPTQGTCKDIQSVKQKRRGSPTQGTCEDIQSVKQKRRASPTQGTCREIEPIKLKQRAPLTQDTCEDIQPVKQKQRGCPTQRTCINIQPVKQKQRGCPTQRTCIDIQPVEQKQRDSSTQSTCIDIQPVKQKQRGSPTLDTSFDQPIKQKRRTSPTQGACSYLQPAVASRKAKKTAQISGLAKTSQGRSGQCSGSGTSQGRSDPGSGAVTSQGRSNQGSGSVTSQGRSGPGSGSVTSPGRRHAVRSTRTAQVNISKSDLDLQVSYEKGQSLMSADMDSSQNKSHSAKVILNKATLTAHTEAYISPNISSQTRTRPSTHSQNSNFNTSLDSQSLSSSSCSKSKVKKIPRSTKRVKNRNVTNDILTKYGTENVQTVQNRENEIDSLLPVPNIGDSTNSTDIQTVGGNTGIADTQTLDGNTSAQIVVNLKRKRNKQNGSLSTSPKKKLCKTTVNQTKTVSKSSRQQGKIVSKTSGQQAKIVSKTSGQQAKIVFKTSGQQAKIMSKTSGQQAKIVSKTSGQQAKIESKTSGQQAKALRSKNREQLAKTVPKSNGNPGIECSELLQQDVNDNNIIVRGVQKMTAQTGRARKQNPNVSVAENSYHKSQDLQCEEKHGSAATLSMYDFSEEACLPQQITIKQQSTPGVTPIQSKLCQRSQGAQEVDPNNWIHQGTLVVAHDNITYKNNRNTVSANQKCLDGDSEYKPGQQSNIRKRSRQRSQTPKKQQKSRSPKKNKKSETPKRDQSRKMPITVHQSVVEPSKMSVTPRRGGRSERSRRGQQAVELRNGVGRQDGSSPQSDDSQVVSIHLYCKLYK